MTAAAASVLVGCGDREPEPRPPAPRPSAAVPSPSAAEITGWPAGLGRALVIRLAAPGDAYRLVVPELGDRRFADSAISLKTGDMLPVTLLGRRGKVGDARLRILDSEAGSGACVTWPAVDIAGATYVRRASAAAWRIAVDRDSVAAVAVDSITGMRAADSLALANAVNSLVSSAPTASDTSLRGIPFGIRSAYTFRVLNVVTIAAELVRTSSTEADPREERMFVVGEREGRDAPVYRLAYSRRLSGRADGVAVTELIIVAVGRQSGRPIIALSVEDGSGSRLQLLERAGRRGWRVSWSSVVTFC